MAWAWSHSLLLVWICPPPTGRRGAPKEGQSCTPRRKGAQGCFQGRCWHKEQALGHSMVGRAGKSPVPSSHPAWGRGDGAAAAGPGMGRESGGSSGQGPAGFKVPCKAQGAPCPTDGDILGSSSPPQTCRPWEGDPGSPHSHGSSSAGPTHPSPRTGASLRITLLQPGRFSSFGRAGEALAQS